jgi:hypothetical protein
VNRLVLNGLLVAMLIGSCRSGPAQAQPPAEAQRRALLVGCTRYPNLRQDWWLRGPANDVILMRTLLTQTFRFPDDAIVTLAEGADTDAPTRDHIEREFGKLARNARAGDQIVIFLSGHGSQQPDQPPFDEDDGVDETFLPADAGYWDRTKRTVENAIVDDELSRWLDAIGRTGARVWLIADSCCSGTLIRGRGRSVPRWVPPGELIPEDVSHDEKAKAAEPRNKSIEDLGRLDGLVALSAAPPDGAAFEEPLPGSDDPYYGRLTYTLFQVCHAGHAPLTYWELARRICLNYDARQWYGPAPMLEGRDQDRARLVLGERDPKPCRFELTRDHRGGYQLKAGALHGLTAGSILAVKGSAPEAVAGQVRIVANGLGSLESEVEPCSPDGIAVEIKLPVPAFCRVVFLDCGDLRVKVAVDREVGAVESPEAAARKTLAAGEQARLVAALRQAASPPGEGRDESFVAPVDDPARADWLVRATSPAADRVVLVPARGWAGGLGHPEALGPFDADPAKIEECVYQIARARNLLKITAGPAELLDSPQPESPLKLEVLRMTDDHDQVGEPIRLDSDQTFRVGDIVGLRVENLGTTCVDVTLLWIDGNYGITAVFPDPAILGDGNRIEPGRRSKLSRLQIDKNGLGREHVVVIGVAPRQLEDYADFSFLADRTFADAERGLRGRRGTAGASATVESPLGLLMQSALFARGGTRGLRRTEGKDYSIRTLSWTTRSRNKTEE